MTLLERIDRRWAARGVVAGIRLYQVSLAWLFRGACRFYPSCSEYAVEAVGKHGAFRGARLASARLLRCHPFSPGGVDPVP